MGGRRKSSAGDPTVLPVNPQVRTSLGAPAYVRLCANWVKASASPWNGDCFRVPSGRDESVPDETVVGEPGQLFACGCLVQPTRMTTRVVVMRTGHARTAGQ
jgi:hypothetical protein